MQRSSYVLISIALVLAGLLGVVGGGIMGGLAGYYAAQLSSPKVLPVSQVLTAPLQTSEPSPVSAGATNLVVKEDSAVIDSVRKVKPAVVTVINQLQARRSFFGGTISPTASGSGVIIDPKGYIITNNHVIEGETSLQVIFADGTSKPATVVGTDSVDDIAVIKVDSTMPAVAEFGDSDALLPGQVAIAIGSPLGDFKGTVTVGVISALDRRVGQQQGLIQTDAAINNGNSGGPLLNATGQVIGINALVVRSSNSGNVAEGLGFAIPSNLVRDIAQQLITKGAVDLVYLGVTFQEVDPQIASALSLNTTEGIVVTQVLPRTPASKAGIQQGDVIMAIDGQKLDQDHSLTGILRNYKVGDTITVTVLRDSNTSQVKVTLEARPAQ